MRRQDNSHSYRDEITSRPQSAYISMIDKKLTRKGLSATKYTLVFRIMAQAVGIAVTIFLVRVLSEHDYGVYNLLYSLIALIGVVFSFGIGNTLQRYIPEYYSKGEFRIANNLYRATSIIRLFSNVVILGSGDFVASLIRDKKELEEKRLEKKITLDELIRSVSDFLGIEESEVLSKTRRRNIGKAKALIAYFSICEMGYKGTEVGRALRIKGPSVSQYIERGKVLVGNEPEMIQKLIN